MRSILMVSAFAALSLAAPRPQDIEWDQVDAAPDVEVVADGVASPTLQSPAAASTIAAAAVSSAAAEKRDLHHLGKRDGNCAAQPAGTYQAITTPADDDASFLSWPYFSQIATASAQPANVPQGYSLAFSNLNASSQTVSWQGYETMSSYDPIACAAYCDQDPQCVAFNIYFERDPTLDPNATNCANPASLTNIKCSRWGVPIQAATATNAGQWRDNFHVVIAGSNGYNKNAPPASQPGFTGPVELAGAINAPLDPTSKQNTYMGYKFFSFADVQSFENGVVACTAACSATTAYDSRHPPTTGKPNVCNQVVVYVLSDKNIPQGIYCSMYTEEWASNYATNVGQWRGSDWWSVSSAYAYTNATYAATYPDPVCAVGGCSPYNYGGNCGGWGAGNC